MNDALTQMIEAAIGHMAGGMSKGDACLKAGLTVERLAYYTRRDPALKARVDEAMEKGGFQRSPGSVFTRKPPKEKPPREASLAEIQRRCDERLGKSG